MRGILDLRCTKSLLVGLLGRTENWETGGGTQHAVVPLAICLLQATSYIIQ